MCFFFYFFFFCFIPVINLIYSCSYKKKKKNGEMSTKTHTHILQFADSTRCQYMYIHTFQFSHYIFAKSMNFVLFFAVQFGALLCFIVRSGHSLRMCDNKWLTCFAHLSARFHRAFHHAKLNGVSTSVLFSFFFSAIDSDLELERICLMVAFFLDFLTQQLWTWWYRNQKLLVTLLEFWLSCHYFQITFTIFLVIGCQLGY